MPGNLKSYPPTWEGDLLLACRKCQKKLKHDSALRPLAKLRKTIKRRNKTHPGAPLHLISVPCMDLCPKKAVTICLPSTRPATLSILRSESDIDEIYPRE